GLQRRLLFPAEEPADALEIDIDHRRDEQRQSLRDEEAADHGQAQRAAQLRAFAQSDRDRQPAHDRGHRRHHDRPETQQAGFVDRVFGCRDAFALPGDGEVDHHDGVFLHDADQHHDADDRDDAEIHAEPHQCQQRAQSRGGQAGQNRDRVDEALIENAEHHVDHQDCRDQQHALTFERLLKDLRGALEAGRYRHREIHPAFELADFLDGLTERYTRREVERDGDRGQQSLMIDQNRTERRAQRRDRRKRNRLVVRGAEIKFQQIGRRLLVFGVDFENHLIIVRRLIDRRDLPDAIGAIKRAAHLIDRDVQRRGEVAIDLDDELAVFQLQVGVDVLDAGQFLDARLQLRRDLVELLRVAVLDRVLILAAGEAAADIDVLNRLEIGNGPRHLGYFTTQALNHLLDILFPNVARLQRDEHAAVIEGRIEW